MKTLKNHTLLYDEDCPLCREYTKQFIKRKLLDENGRKPINSISEDEKVLIHPVISRNKVALINNITGEVTYGLESVLKILTPNNSFLRWLVSIRWIKYCFYLVYTFVSMNRRVFMPTDVNSGKIECKPTFNINVRLSLIVIFTLFSGLILALFTPFLAEYISEGSVWRELLIAVGQMVFMYLFVIRFGKEESLNYLGNLAVVSFVGSIGLLPLVIIGQFVIIDPLVALLWFNTVFTFMFLEHFRRVKLLGMPKVLCLTWLAYRGILLIFLL